MLHPCQQEHINRIGSHMGSVTSVLGRERGSTVRKTLSITPTRQVEIQ